MTDHREPIPPGRVSTVRGRWQRPALTLATTGALIIAFAGLVIPGEVGDALVRFAVGIVVAVPLLRVVWLCFRFGHERDWRFVLAGTGLLGLVGLAAVLAMLRVA